ncbi:MAG: hypothetical protein SVR08_13715 [Spirochaetota bacterium]|nr:hypothetical protein [Spirochaetota bacterium]
MGNTLDIASNKLSEQTKKLNIASYYTHENEELAKEMLNGNYNDLFVIKVKFSASSLFGAFLLFFNFPFSTLQDLYVIVTSSFDVDDIKTDIGWRIFEKDIKENLTKDEHDKGYTLLLQEELTGSFTLQPGSNQRGSELKKQLELDDEIIIHRIFKKFIMDRMGFQNIHISVDYEAISSLDMELYSSSSKKIDPRELTKINKGEDEEVQIETDEDVDIDKENAEMILQGSMILSPISGKPVSDIAIGDRIRIHLEKNQKSVHVAKAFKAYENDTIQPITGRVVSIRRQLSGGYKIFSLIAKGIYVKIEEEEENIKVAIDETENIGKQDDESTTKSRLMLIISVIIGIILILTMLIIFL